MISESELRTRAYRRQQEINHPKRVETTKEFLARGGTIQKILSMRSYNKANNITDDQQVFGRILANRRKRVDSMPKCHICQAPVSSVILNRMNAPHELPAIWICNSCAAKKRRK